MRTLITLLLLGASVALAADPAEISFWESVRDSRDAGELRAYLERYPNGDFAVLARRRITALESAGTRPAPPQQQQSAPATASNAPSRQPPAQEIAWTLPQPGDTWTYRLREPKRIEGPKERELVITATSVSGSEVVDQLKLGEGSTPLESRHVRGPHLIAQGASLFSPYLPLITASGAPPTASVGRVRIVDPACTGRYICDAKGRMIGKETVRVPAGTFAASKIIVEESWRSTFVNSGGGSGGRILTVWYAPEVKRVVKYTSRTTFGFNPPMEPDFEVELLSFKVN